MEEKEVILTQEGYDNLDKEFKLFKNRKKSRNSRKNKSCIRIW